jgi:serine/threonine protein kinase
MNKRIFIDNYELINKIGSGSFGEVYIARNKTDKQVYAAKIEDAKDKNRLKSEYNIYKKINKDNRVNGIPKVYNFIQTSEYNILIMEMLGPSLESKFDNNDRKISLQCLFKVGLDMLELIRNFHRRGFIHRDIKPNNFLFNYQKPLKTVFKADNSNQNDDKILPFDKLYLMDFGLSKPYIINYEHIDIKFDRSLIGTARYCSLNIHWGIEPSRRDDLESIAYILIYLFKGVLPWQGLKKDKNKNQVEKIGDKKLTTQTEDLCKDMPDCFRLFLDYVRKLKFEQKPDYDHIFELFNNDITKLNITPQYDWD